MSDPLVTVATFGSLEEAQLAKLHLEGEGVDAFVPDENVLSIGYSVPVLFGGVKLQVLQSAARQAVEILSQPTVGNAAAVVAGRAAANAPRRLACPQCGSSAIVRKRTALGERLLGLLLLGIPLLLARPQWTCRVCGSHWRT